MTWLSPHKRTENSSNFLTFIFLSFINTERTRARKPQTHFFPSLALFMRAASRNCPLKTTIFNFWHGAVVKTSSNLFPTDPATSHSSNNVFSQLYIHSRASAAWANIFPPEGLRNNLASAERYHSKRRSKLLTRENGLFLGLDGFREERLLHLFVSNYTFL